MMPWSRRGMCAIEPALGKNTTSLATNGTRCMRRRRRRPKKLSGVSDTLFANNRIKLKYTRTQTNCGGNEEGHREEADKKNVCLWPQKARRKSPFTYFSLGLGGESGFGCTITRHNEVKLWMTAGVRAPKRTMIRIKLRT